MLELKESKGTNFSAKNQNGNNISLTQFLGKKLFYIFTLRITLGVQPSL